jgi:hypothetical protein
MRRREVLTGFCAGICAPAAAQIARAKQVGVLFPGEWGVERLELFEHAVAKSGSGSISVVVRNAQGDPQRLRAFAQERPLPS